MTFDIDRRSALGRLGAGCLALSPAALLAAEDEAKTYDEDSILKAATEFFGSTTEGLAKVIEKAFKEQGRPNAYIKGEEASAALTVGLRYGDGQLQMKSGATARVFWAGPSIGLDAGANASKVFTLVYKLPNAAAIYQRFPGVEGSLYYIGGAGINYQRNKGITLAPIRLGVGLRSGASVGYLHYRREKSLNPF
ncbi:DUF1134 domain-containing protein [Paucibacter sp. O1-1]|uniref:DUF1134 domain-containing protein n=1 Tax=Paucibacter sp. M5-1 TaxID=3015998 RepID=UPI0010F7094A|nr:DUF1134 domain-containing protein [Paucibacter sp. M5-1]MCU7373677.1 DUF1134 domain-containing protein [Paucibacter sp. O1-1]MCZ7879970.1 DUF1134 domain-containing protein [Paucibacter sp. M5-1]MDA3828678.1 DUF1134 domain-containing protein [Paucibacter sp. O1-1]